MNRPYKKNKNMKKLLLSLSASFVLANGFAQTNCADLFISEIDEGSYNNKALEVYNPTSSPISLSNYRLVRYSNGNAAFDPIYATVLSGTVAPYGTYVFVLDKRIPGATGQDTIVFDALRALADTFLCPDYTTNPMLYFNGNDAMTLDKFNGTGYDQIDIFGKIGEDPGAAWTDAPPGYTAADGGAYWTKDHSLIRKASIEHGVTLNPSVFNATIEWDSLSMNDWSHLRAHTCACFTGISENQVPQVSVFPNPVSNGKVTIQANANIIHVEIYNVLGELVGTVNNGKMERTMNLSISGLKPGAYMIRAYYADSSIGSGKILVE